MPAIPHMVSQNRNHETHELHEKKRRPTTKNSTVKGEKMLGSLRPHNVHDHFFSWFFSCVLCVSWFGETTMKGEKMLGSLRPHNVHDHFFSWFFSCVLCVSWFVCFFPPLSSRVQRSLGSEALRIET